jgi:hypothetical protein
MYSYYYEDVYDKYEKAKERFENEFVGESFVTEEEFVDGYCYLNEQE